MAKYTKERKEAVLRKMLSADTVSMAQLSREESISEATLYAWRLRARKEGRILPNQTDLSNKWTSKTKFSAVIATASLNEAQSSIYCREKGIVPIDLARWRESCEEANDWNANDKKELETQVRSVTLENKELSKNLLRKDRALAETAALLVLEKKLQAIWGAKDE